MVCLSLFSQVLHSPLHISFHRGALGQEGLVQGKTIHVKELDDLPKNATPDKYATPVTAF